GYTASRIEIEANRLCQLQYGYPISVSGLNQERNLIVKGDFGLKDVEPRHRSGVKPVLLVFKLALEQTNRLFLDRDQSPIDQNLVELRLYRGDHLIKNVSKGEVGTVPLEKCSTNRAQRAVVKDELLTDDANVVSRIHLV